MSNAKKIRLIIDKTKLVSKFKRGCGCGRSRTYEIEQSNKLEENKNETINTNKTLKFL